MKGRVLIIAGSDPSGGAGIQADIKTVTALGGYAATAITALTVQNTKGVSAVHLVPVDVVHAQIHAVLDDIGADAIKIGMIGNADIAALIAETLSSRTDAIPVVLDPVLAATSGDALSNEGVADFIRRELTPLASLITPNTQEATVLTGIEIETRENMIAAGKKLLAAGATAALIKGGHMTGKLVRDVLVTSGTAEFFSNPRLDTTSTHGTGCTLASAIAAGLAQDMKMAAAVGRAVDYVRQAINTAPGYGGGHGPLNHGHTFKDD